MKLSTPAAEPIRWRCRSQRTSAIVLAQTWFRARELGSVLLGAPLEATEVEIAEPVRGDYEPWAWEV